MRIRISLTNYWFILYFKRPTNKKIGFEISQLVSPIWNLPTFRSMVSPDACNIGDLGEKKEESFSWAYEMLPHLRAFHSGVTLKFQRSPCVQLDRGWRAPGLDTFTLAGSLCDVDECTITRVSWAWKGTRHHW